MICCADVVAFEVAKQRDVFGPRKTSLKAFGLLLCLTVEVLVGKLCVSRSAIQNKWEQIGIAVVQYHVW